MKKRLVKKSDYLWNMLGSVCYSGSSFYYLLLVTRICGVKEAGVFSLAFATSQLLLTIGRFGVRTYQATDLGFQYSFKEYGFSRIVTCFAMLLGAVVYVVIMRFSLWKAGVCIWVTAFKMIDAVEDVFHGELQRCYRVDLMGKLLAIRNVVSGIIFTVILFLTNNLLSTCVFTTIGSLLICCAGNVMVLKHVVKNIGDLHIRRILDLLKICFPIFISTFLSLYLYNLPKYAIDFYMEVENQTYYSILFMPSFVITLFSEIIVKPVMTTVAIEWEKSIEEFCKRIVCIMKMTFCGTVLTVVGGHVLGRYLLELIYDVNLSPYRWEFVILLIGGGLSASTYILYNLLIAIRHEKCIVITYGFIAVMMTGFIFLNVKKFGMFGAAIGYFMSCLSLCMVFATILIMLIKKKAKNSLAL